MPGLMRLPISGELSLQRIAKGLAIAVLLSYIYFLFAQGAWTRTHRHSHLLETNAISASVVFVQKRPPMFVGGQVQENYAYLFEVAVEVRNNTNSPIDASELPSIRAQMSDGSNIFGDFFVHQMATDGKPHLERPQARKYFIAPGRAVVLLYVLFAPTGAAPNTHPVVISLASDDEQKPLPPKRQANGS